MLRNPALQGKIFILYLSLSFLVAFPAAHVGHAASSVEIDAKVDAVLQDFYGKVGAGKKLAPMAEGILIFPSVLKAGFWIGGQYGEGALRINDTTVDYYNIAGASLGFQFGAQSKAFILFFMKKKALSGFRDSKGWEAGVDGSVALANIGAGGTLDTNTHKKPIIGFVFDNKGLMVDLSLKGTKISKINK